MRGLPRGAALPALLLLALGPAVLAAEPELAAAYSSLEERRMLVTSRPDGTLEVAGYAVPPPAVSTEVLPPAGAVLTSADKVRIVNKPVAAVLEAISRGDFDNAVLPILYDVEGVEGGKELGGFIKVQFVTPESLRYRLTDGAGGIQEVSEDDGKSRVRSIPYCCDTSNPVRVQTVFVLREPLGVEIKDRNGKPTVAVVAESSAFKKAGVSIFDELTHVNGNSVVGMSTDGVCAGGARAPRVVSSGLPPPRCCSQRRWSSPLASSFPSPSPSARPASPLWTSVM